MVRLPRWWCAPLPLDHLLLTLLSGIALVVLVIMRMPRLDLAPAPLLTLVGLPLVLRQPSLVVPLSVSLSEPSSSMGCPYSGMISWY